MDFTIVFCIMLIGLTQHMSKIHTATRCHPERPEEIADYRRESKDLRTDLTAHDPSVRRFFDSAAAPLRMTDLWIVRFSDLLIQADKHFLY